MVNPQEFTSPAQKRISLIKPKASQTLLHIRLVFSRSLKAVVPKHVASSCFGTVRFKLCNKTKQCRRIKPFRVSLSRVISQTNFTEIQRVTVSRTRASTQDRLLSVRSLVFLPPPNYREKPSDSCPIRPVFRFRNSSLPKSLQFSKHLHLIKCLQIFVIKPS